MKTFLICPVKNHDMSETSPYVEQLVVLNDIILTEGKSFANMITAWSEQDK